MSTGTGNKEELKCGETRKWVRALERRNSPDEIPDAVLRHLSRCDRCAFQHRLSRLERTVLDLAGAARQVTPDEEFFKGLRARIARGDDVTGARVGNDQTWPLLMWVAARQVLPAMAILLLLIVGATLLWGTGSTQEQMAGSNRPNRPIDRIIVLPESDGYQPTADDVLESLVALEENVNVR
jgi:hypothetical protein